MLRRIFRVLKRILTPGGDLTGSAVTSGIWETLINVGDRALRLLLVVVLARFLAPEDFGLIGIALVTLGALSRLSQLGLNTALIQNRSENVDEYLNTTWILQIARGIVIAMVGFVIAPYAADFFSEPRATDLIRVISLGPLLRGLKNPGMVYLEKNLEFNKRFAFEMSGALLNVCVAITLAVILQNVWALVFGKIAEDVGKVVSSYILHDYRPSVSFSRQYADELIQYGKWITASGMVLFLFSSGDDAFVGWFIGASALGIYQIAYQFSNAPATEVTHIISRVAFPAYSKVQDDLHKLREGYFRTLQLTTFFSFPMAAGIIVVAPTFVRAFLGPDWTSAITVMQILAVFGALRSFGATYGPLFQAISRPDINTKLQVMNLVVLAVLIYPLTDLYGIDGTALAVLGVSVITPIPAYIVIKSIEGSPRRFITTLGYPLAASVFMGVGVFVASTYIVTELLIVKFVLLVLLGVVLYAGATLWSVRWFSYDIMNLLRSMRESVT
jgi:PST family polysaccharide transporter/lipopolysaccharide exporter